MQKATLNQRKSNRLIAAVINSDERTAFMNATHVKRLLTEYVTPDLFISLVNVCHKVGINSFSNSLAVKMVNTNHSEAHVKRYIRAMSNKV